MTMDTGGGTVAAPQDISGAVTNVIVRRVRSQGGDEAVARALGLAGETRPVTELEDPRSWSTHDQTIALLAAAGRVTRDPDIGRSVGEDILRQHDGTEVANLLRSLGSPGELLRNVTAAAAKFTTVSTLESLEVGDAHAVVRAHTRPGFVRHPYLCQFTKGLLSQVPVLFGLVPAVVTETECQAQGGRFCLYSVAWEERQWTAFVDERASLYTAAWAEQGVVENQSELEIDAQTRITQLEQQLARSGQALQEVFSTASDLLAGDNLNELLSRITQRAAAAVNAPRYLLVVRVSPGQPAQLHQHGFTEDEARQLAEELWRPEPDDAAGSRLIVDIVSSRQAYGRLAAVYPTARAFMEQERLMLGLYATYAATALDLVRALNDSRRSNATARALLSFSASLTRIGTTDEVAQTLADTVPAVVGCDRSSVMLWDPFDRQLVFRAVSGGLPETPVARPADGERITFVATEDEAEAEPPEGLEPPEPDFSVIRLDDTPVLAELMSSRDIVVIDRASAGQFHQAVFERYGTTVTAMAPLFSDDEFLGVVAADFLRHPAVDPRVDADLQERLTALANQAVTSFQNAWLLEQVGHLAWHDSLTGLPNRRLLEDRVVQELERAKRVGENSSMFFVDLDRFKRVNDTLGHATGDELLKQVAQRLRDTVRRQDTVARLGGDEFAILLPGLSDPVAVRQLAGRMLDLLHEPYLLEGVEVYASASIGVSLSPDHGDTYDDLLSHADEAMYRAKAMGRNTFQIYDGGPADAVTDVQLMADLHHAVERDELFVLYQPYVDLATNEVVGVEALVRWRHPVKGVLEPADFIPQAEESSLILGIDAFVIEQACRQLAEWRGRGLTDLRVSVNVAGRDLMDGDFVDLVLGTLEGHDIPTDHFELEITERVTLDADGVMRQTVEKLQEHGVRFSIDDFGTGASSLQQVAAFPVSTLKIDRSFVQILGPSEELSALASAIIGMAEKLGLDCVAEGVETSHQSRVLLQRGCGTAQGFFFSPPLVPADVERMLAGGADSDPVPETLIEAARAVEDEAAARAEDETAPAEVEAEADTGVADPGAVVEAAEAEPAAEDAAPASNGRRRGPRHAPTTPADLLDQEGAEAEGAEAEGAEAAAGGDEGSEEPAAQADAPAEAEEDTDAAAPQGGDEPPPPPPGFDRAPTGVSEDA
jgi:diguanylate cyclase (GGDEF)-like protein